MRPFYKKTSQACPAKPLKRSGGFALVEAMVACAIIVTATFALVSSAQKGIALSNLALEQTKASYLLEEGAEATKTVRDSGWSNISGLTVGTTYYPSYSNTTNTWSLGASAPANPTNPIDGLFTRSLVISAVNRDSTTEDIVTSGGTLDANTKKVTVTVSWPSPSGTQSKTLSLYMSNIF